jgi:hypothetical protein
VDNGQVWGRSVGISVGPDGSLLVTDAGSESICRISFAGTCCCSPAESSLQIALLRHAWLV